MSISAALRLVFVASKHLPPLFVLTLVGFAPLARADIQLDFVYDPLTGATTATYSGSWGAWTGAIQDTGASGGISATGIAHYGSQSSYINTSVFLGATIPWTANTTSSGFSGDAWGFNSGRVIAPSTYLANGTINGSLTFAGMDLATFGFDATEIANGGTIGSGSYIVHWTASTTAIPEPATNALLFGLAVVGFAVCRNRRGAVGRTGLPPAV
ncbi:MAG TPA: hypothetical protein VG936_09065 [Lacunisphaera sp.]|nr:hypothetical protein [Lacunisphaera sp.]